MSANGSSRPTRRTLSTPLRYIPLPLSTVARLEWCAMLTPMQKIVYPYVWGEYNVLILPPSFPYGGMENPIFTFATPSIISKVRSHTRKKEKRGYLTFELTCQQGPRECRCHRPRVGSQLERQPRDELLVGAFLAQRRMDCLP
jgi:hypothetical protein